MLPTRTDQYIAMFPLRLEMRRVQGRISRGRFEPREPDQVFFGRGNTQFTHRERILAYGEQDVGATQYWLRWYPDDIAMLVPPSRPSGVERRLVAELREVYNAQEGAEAVAAVDQAFINAHAGGDAGEAERQLSIHNGLRPGRLSAAESAACRQYNDEALAAILSEWRDQTVLGIDPDSLRIGRRMGWDLYDFDNPVLQRAWQALVQEVGVVRARYLVSDPSGDAAVSIPDATRGSMEQGIRIGLMPQRIFLYTVCDSVATELGPPIQVDRPGELYAAMIENDATQWMIDFDQALARGMGAKIHDAGLVAQIDAADWLIAFGVREKARGTPDMELEHVLRGLRSRGKLGIALQDSPTNNTENDDSDFATIETDVRSWFERTRTALPRAVAWPPPAGQFEHATSNGITDAQLLARALQLDPRVLGEIPGSGAAAQTEAEAMALLVWRCSSEWLRAFWSPPVQNQTLWSALEAVFVRLVRGRGPLPVLRTGSNPYGILPVVDLKTWAPAPGVASDEHTVLHWIAKMARLLWPDFMRLANDIPTLSDAPEEQIYDALLDILRVSAVSKRVYIRDFPLVDGIYQPEDELRSVAGPLVSDLIVPHVPLKPGESDLGFLAAVAEGTLTGEGEFEHYSAVVDGKVCVLRTPREMITLEWTKPELKLRFSLLHRLMSMFVYGIDPQPPAELEARRESLRVAARYLAGVPLERLDVLVMEVLDTLCFRFDAWVTALGTHRLDDCLAQAGVYHDVGMYGWIEKPGEVDMEPQAAEYIQTPSLEQAAAAAIVRNAAAHGGNTTAATRSYTNLASERVKQGEWYLDSLRQQEPAGELLGRRLEALIHEEAEKAFANATSLGETYPRPGDLEDKDIYALREIFRLPTQAGTPAQDGKGNAPATVVDGRKFIDEFDGADFGAWPEEKVATLRSLRDRLSQVPDAGGDMAMGDALYQLMRDNPARVAAWIDFLDGEALPPEPQFVRTVRTGQDWRTRIFLSLDVPSPFVPGDETHAAAYADPVLERLCETLFPDWDQETVVVSYRARETDTWLQVAVSFDDLQWRPIDLAVTNEGELLGRARLFLLRRWKDSEEGALGPFPTLGSDIGPWEALDVRLAASSLPNGYLGRADALRALLGRTRKEGDLPTFDPSVDSCPAVLGTQSGKTTDWDAMDAGLRLRIGELEELIGSVLDDLEALRGDGDALLAALADPLANRALLHTAELGLPRTCLVLPRSASEGAEAGEAAVDRQARIERGRAQLEEARERLQDRLDKHGERQPGVDLLVGRARVVARASLLAALAGREGLSILVPFVCQQAEGWGAGDAPALGGGLGGFPLAAYESTQPAVRDLRRAFVGPGYSITRLSREGRDEICYATHDAVSGQPAIAMLMVEHISEFIGSREEATGLAVRYRSPSTQAPNGVLLLVPSVLDTTGWWTEQSVADSLVQTMDLMRIRMLSSLAVTGDNNLGRYLPLTVFDRATQALYKVDRAVDEFATSDGFVYEFETESADGTVPEPPIVAERR